MFFVGRQAIGSWQNRDVGRGWSGPWSESARVQCSCNGTTAPLKANSILRKWSRPARSRRSVPHLPRVLDGSDDAELVTFYEDDEKKSS
jgi:hypothetical protein